MGPEGEPQPALDNSTHTAGNSSSSPQTQSMGGNVTLEDIRAIIQQPMAEVGQSKLVNSHSASPKPVFEHTYIEQQFEQNVVWLQKLNDIDDALRQGSEQTQELVQDLVKDIEERQAWLELGDKDPSVLKRMDLDKEVDRISSKVSLPKSTVENILKDSVLGGNTGPNKKPRYSPYSTDRREPFSLA